MESGKDAVYVTPDELLNQVNVEWHLLPRKKPNDNEEVAADYPWALTDMDNRLELATRAVGAMEAGLDLSEEAMISLRRCISSIYVMETKQAGNQSSEQRIALDALRTLMHEKGWD